MDLSSIHLETQLNVYSSSSSKRLVPDHQTDSNPRPWVILSACHGMCSGALDSNPRTWVILILQTQQAWGYPDSNPRTWVIQPDDLLLVGKHRDSNPRPWVILGPIMWVRKDGADSNPRSWVIPGPRPRQRLRRTDSNPRPWVIPLDNVEISTFFLRMYVCLTMLCTPFITSISFYPFTNPILLSSINRYYSL